jgi:hypothetical protein
MEKFDFSGWATRNDLLCGDGRTIRKNAFKDNDGQTVPLVWNHDHANADAVLGHALLENRDDGVYAYCRFNDTEQGINAKKLVTNGDVRSLSIYANKLKQIGNDVIHGSIKELSLVLAGANPGAFIDFVMAHGEEEESSMIASYDENALVLYHSDESEETEKVEETQETEEVPDVSHADTDEKDDEDKTVAQILDEMTDEQKAAVYYVAGVLAGEDEEQSEETDNEEDTTMKHNVFENDTQQDATLMHADIVNNAIADGKRFGTLKDSLLAHAAENNITNISELFPNEHDLHMPPEWYKEDDDSWVAKVMRGVHHVPFSRVRALFAKMDEATARAHGYIKGNEKQVGLKLSILKRTTKPTTVYIKMAMDRDDLVDIQYDALPWIRAEGRKVLDAELARAYLFGDKRDPSDDDKIDEQCIRPILTDDDMYTIKYTVTDGKDFHNDFNSASENDSEAKGVIRAAIKSRKGYKGSGNLTFFTTEDLVTELLLIEDQNGRRIYESEAALCTALRCKEIVTVPELEQYEDVYGIFVNMNDYQVGADKGGQVTTFEDFDIDYNKEKILMETRCSAALVKPKSAIVLKKAVAAG